MKQLLKKSPILVKANSTLKGCLQDYKNKCAVRKYQNAAKAKGLESTNGDTLTSDLRKRLSKHGNISPKVIGNMHIFLAYYVSNWESVLPESLEPFGRVSVFNWREHGFDDRKQNWLTCRDQMNVAMLDAFHKANQEEHIDVVIGYLSGYNTSPQTLLHMSNSGAVIFNFCWDDKLNFPGKKLGGRFTSPASIAHAVDLNLTNSPDSVIKYAVHDGLALFWPEAALPDIHRPYDVPFEFDVSFVGACYGRRPFFISRLKKLGIKVECFGKGWPNGIVSNEEITKIYSRSRINLGFAGVGHSRKLMCLKGRDFEVPMSGGLYLTQDNPELSRVYDIGKEILTYKNKKDCAEIIRKLLANPKQAESIRKAGKERCMADHTYEKRWMKIFSMAGLLQK